MRLLSDEEIHELALCIQQFLQREDFLLLLKQIKHEISLHDNHAIYGALIFRVLNKANAGSWHDSLLAGLRVYLPENEYIIRLSASLGQDEEDQYSLEAYLNGGAEMMDLAETLRWFVKLERQVCRLEISLPAGVRTGTGFLVGPDLLLSNYHVIEGLESGELAVDAVLARFDYKTLKGENESVVSNGKTYRLHAGEPVIEFSKYHAKDESGADLSAPWPEDHLDFALLKLEKEVGYELPDSISHPAGSAAIPRGWLTFPRNGFELDIDDTLMIVQHPEGKPITWCIDTNAIIGRDPGEQRVRYRTTTKKGSSGSPCFNSDLQLVALHHAGDPNFWQPGYNQGIPIMRIVEYLTSSGMRDSLTFGELNLDPIELPLTESEQTNTDECFKSVFINESFPFIPRDKFNNKLGDMVRGQGGRVAIISGEPRTGLTYSFHYIQQEAKRHNFRSINLSLKFLFSQEGIAKSLPLAEHLINKMQVDYILPEESEFKLSVFFSSFAGIVREMEGNYLIYIDDLATFPMTENCIHFITSLAITIQTDLPNVHLILAGFDKSRLYDIAPFVEHVNLKSFSDENLKTFFDSFYNTIPQRTGMELDESQAEFAENSRKMVIEMSDFDDVPNVESVGTNVKKLCDTLVEDLRAAT